jgi:hypothetical protein
MQRDDGADFEALLQQVFECYDRKAPSTAAATMWFDALKEFLYPDVRSALLYWIKSKPKLPTIAEVLVQLRDRKSVGLEKRADTDKRTFAAAGAAVVTEAGERGVETAKDFLGTGKRRDCKQWARDIIAARDAGLNVSSIQVSLAAEALSRNAVIREPGEDDE